MHWTKGLFHTEYPYFLACPPPAALLTCVGTSQGAQALTVASCAHSPAAAPRSPFTAHVQPVRSCAAVSLGCGCAACTAGCALAVAYFGTAGAEGARPRFKPASRGSAADDSHGFWERFALFAAPFMFPQVAAAFFFFFFFVAPLSKLLFLLVIIMIRIRRGSFNKVLHAAWEKGRSAVSSSAHPCDSPSGTLLYCLNISYFGRV